MTNIALENDALMDAVTLGLTFVIMHETGYVLAAPVPSQLPIAVVELDVATSAPKA